MNRLNPYDGPFPGSQTSAEISVRKMVESADGRFVSRQASAVLRYLTDEISRLKDRVAELELERPDSQGFSR